MNLNSPYTFPSLPRCLDGGAQPLAAGSLSSRSLSSSVLGFVGAASPWATRSGLGKGRWKGRGGGYLQQCRGQSLSPAEGWPRLCNSPLRSPGWQGRRDRRQVLGCWPPGSLRAAPGWSLPGKRARQNSVEHCSYSGLVCRE